MEALILEQLVWIKWALVATAIASGIVAVFAVLAIRSVASMPEIIRGRAGFENQARALMNQGENEKLLELCDSHILRFPADATGYYFMGHAHHRLGNLRPALQCFRKISALQPDWEASHVQPMIAALEERLAEATEKRGLKVVTPEDLPRIDPPIDRTLER